MNAESFELFLKCDVYTFEVQLEWVHLCKLLVAEAGSKYFCSILTPPALVLTLFNHTAHTSQLLKVCKSQVVQFKVFISLNMFIFVLYIL